MADGASFDLYTAVIQPRIARFRSDWYSVWTSDSQYSTNFSRSWRQRDV